MPNTRAEHARVCGEIIAACIAAEDTIYAAYRKLVLVRLLTLTAVLLGAAFCTWPSILPIQPGVAFAVGMGLLLASGMVYGTVLNSVCLGWAHAVSAARKLMWPKGNLGQRVLALTFTIDQCSERGDSFSVAMLKHKADLAKAQGIIRGPDPYYATARTDFSDHN